MACNDCENGNPITPVYSNAKYVLNGNCSEVCAPEIYVPPGGGDVTTHELISGTDILIENFSSGNDLSHKINYDPFTALVANLTLNGYVGGLVQPSIILKGKIVDETRAIWTYNKGIISSQTLDEGSGPVAAPVLDRDKTTTSLTITDDVTYTLEGDDGQGEAGSIDSDTASLIFGNEMIWGDYTNMNGQAVTGVAAFIAALADRTTEIKLNRLNTIYATGLVNRRFFVIYPASWGLATFTKQSFIGGFTRLKNEGGTLTTSIPAVEIPISWTNAEGHAEDIYIYQSQYDNAEDAVNPIIIT